MSEVNKVSEAGALYSVKELKHIAEVDNKFNIKFVQNCTTPPDLSTPEGRAAARIGNFANRYMEALLEDGGAFNWKL